MLSIINTWKEYFINHNEGLGTTYERFILHRYFRDIKKKYSVGSVLEVPSFGMTGVSGINSMWWAHKGLPVTVVDDNRERIESVAGVWKETGLPVNLVFNRACDPFPFDDKSFDMSWNFAALWFIKDLGDFLKEQCRVTRKVIFICVPNRFGIGHRIRFAERKKTSGKLNMDNIEPEVIRNAMKINNWRLVEEGYFDVPPWPDIAMKKEQLFQKIGLSKFSAKGNDEESREETILDFFRYNKKSIEKNILKYSFLENSPLLLKKYWSHHHYFIFERPITTVP